jgi:hypothetical protein
MPYGDPVKRKEYQRAWNLRNRDKVAGYRRGSYQRYRGRLVAYQRDWKKRNPEKRFEYVLRTRYGIGAADYMALLEKQGGICPICGEPPRLPSVDHDHDTGLVRGILCRTCNSALGVLDTVERLRAAMAYLCRS